MSDAEKSGADAAMQKMFSGQPVTPLEWQAYFSAFHADHTSPDPPLAKLRTAEGKSTYELLAECLPKDAANTLDIGCGDGAFVPFWRQKLAASSFAGVDICAGSIARARHVFADKGTRFFITDAAHLPFSTALFDIVVAHLVLLLIEPLQPAMCEIRRVLRPGGKAAFLVEDRATAGSALGALVQEATLFLRTEYPHFHYATTNEKNRSTPALEKIVRDSGFERLEIDRVSASTATDVAGAVKFLESLYIFGSLTPTLRLKFARHMTAAARTMHPSDQVQIDLSFRLIRCR